MVVQACQLLSTHDVSPADFPEVIMLSDPIVYTPTADPQYNMHIVLKRSHTALLIATVTGGEAVRGLFTGAIADEIRKSDGKTDVSAMFNSAVFQMRRGVQTSVKQQPEFRATTEKNLVLPPARH